MLETAPGRRALTTSEVKLLEAARQRAEFLYRGDEVPHHSCGIALATTFGVPSRPYQSLRRGGISGERMCGAIRAGELLLGELLGDPSATGAVTEQLRSATLWYQEQFPTRLDPGPSPDYICNHVVASLGDFSGKRRADFCTNWAGEVAALALEAILRFAPEHLPQSMNIETAS